MKIDATLSIITRNIPRLSGNTGVTGEHVIPGAEQPEGGHLSHGDPAHIEHRHHLVTGARILEAVAGQHRQYVPDIPPVKGLKLLHQRIDTNIPGVDRLSRLCSSCIQMTSSSPICDSNIDTLHYTFACTIYINETKE